VTEAPPRIGFAGANPQSRVRNAIDAAAETDRRIIIRE
jgi:hypothetical protein